MTTEHILPTPAQLQEARRAQQKASVNLKQARADLGRSQAVVGERNKRVTEAVITMERSQQRVQDLQKAAHQAQPPTPKEAKQKEGHEDKLLKGHEHKGA